MLYPQWDKMNTVLQAQKKISSLQDANIQQRHELSAAMAENKCHLIKKKIEVLVIIYEIIKPSLY